MAVDASRAKSLFLAASDLADLLERSAYLGHECAGNAELRDRVEALLRANDAAPLPPEATIALFPDRPQPTKDYGDPTARVGTVIAGKYKLIEEIGEGGMGQVFMAQQTEPVKRAVAIKVIKAGMDSKAVLARFEAERQALAMMDHPNIAKVLEAGTTDGGRPYFVMELVKGQAITKFCDERKLTPRQRLELFVPVCQAIQHAHQKGVIHRDIKPSNVLVAMYDDRPVPKVIDFGVAKAAGQTLTDKTLMTGLGAVVGTAEYMSPEQANMNNLDIDTRSDVYSLGVLLYELLTGTTPVDKKSLGKAAILEVLRIVREVEAPKPSHRLSTVEGLPSVAANRGTEPAKLSNLMKGELDWVVLKALEKDRVRRYDTANALSRDIQRYLADEVVEARPPSTGYRLKKLFRRNKGTVLAGVAVAVALIAGVAAVVAVQHQANIDLAFKNAKLAEQQAEVETRFELAQKAIATFHTGVSEEALLTNDNLKELRTKLLKQAAGFYADLEKLLAGKTDTKSRKLLAKGYTQLGNLTEKIGDQKEALAVQRRALALRRELAMVADTDVETRLDVAHSQNLVGLLLVATGDLAGAMRAFEEQRDLAAALEMEAPTDAVRQELAYSHHRIGWLLSQTGKLAEALAAYDRAREIQQRLADANLSVTRFQSDLAKSHHSIGMLLFQTGKPTDAIEATEKARAIRQKLADANPSVTEFQSNLATSHNDIGHILAQTGKLMDALAAHEKGLDIQLKLAAANSAINQFQSNLALSYNNIGHILDQTGKLADALVAFERTRGIQQKLVEANPNVTFFQRELAICLFNIGGILSQTGKHAEALAVYQQALDMRQKLADANPNITNFQSDLAQSHSNFGWVLAKTGKPTEALAKFTKARDIWLKLTAANPNGTLFQRELAQSYNNIGLLLSQASKHAEALVALRQARDIRQKVADANPTVAQFQSDLAWGHHNMGNVLAEVGTPTDVLATYTKARDIWLKLVDTNPNVTSFQRGLATSYNNAGRILARLERFPEAFAELDRGMVLRQKLADAEPKNTEYANHLGYSHAYRGWARIRAGQPQEAANDLRRAISIWAKTPAPSIDMRFETGRALALLTKLGADAKSGVTATEVKSFGNQAMSALADAIKAGSSNLAELKQPDFDAVRGRDTFKNLEAELEKGTEKK